VYAALAGVSKEAAEAWLSQTSDDGDGDDHGDDGDHGDHGDDGDDGLTLSEMYRILEKVTGEFLNKKQAKFALEALMEIGSQLGLEFDDSTLGIMDVIMEIGSQLGLQGDDVMPLGMVNDLRDGVYSALAGVSQKAAEAWLSQTSDHVDGDDHGDHGDHGDGDGDDHGEDHDDPLASFCGAFRSKKECKAAAPFCVYAAKSCRVALLFDSPAEVCASMSKKKCKAAGPLCTYKNKRCGANKDIFGQ